MWTNWGGEWFGEPLRLSTLWYGGHAFRRGLASNLYAMGSSGQGGATDLGHSKPHVTREHYIKVFDSSVLEAAGKVQSRI